MQTDGFKNVAPTKAAFHLADLLKKDNEPFSIGILFNTAFPSLSDNIKGLLKAIHSQYKAASLNPSKSYPLHLAAALGDMQSASTLLKSGYCIEQRDDLNLTPLQVACVSGQASMASFLIEKGANVLAVDGYKFNLNALDLAIMESHANVVDILITQGHALDKADVFSLANLYDTAFGLIWAHVEGEESHAEIRFKAALDTFMVIVKSRPFPLLEFPVSNKKNSPEVTGMPAAVILEILATQVTTKAQYNQIMAEIEKLNEHDSSYKTYLDAKALFHVLPVHGNYPITYQTPDHKAYTTKISAEGHWGSFTTPMAYNLIHAYLEDTPFSEDQSFIVHAFKSLETIYQAAIVYSKECAIFENSQEAYGLYQQGQPLLLPTGWDGHFVNIILDPINDYFVIANCGMRFQGLSGGANIYKMYNPLGVTPDLIYSILNNTDQMNLELVFKYQLALDKVEEVYHPDQIHGNCAWQSHEPAIEALLYIDFLNQGYTPSQALLWAHDQYVTWDAYQTLSHLKNYFENEPALGITALKDILIENHSSLFVPKNKHLDKGINPVEYEQAKYIISILNQDPYRKEVASVFSDVLKKAKPELLNLFKAEGFMVKILDKLDIQDLLLQEANECLFQEEGIDLSLFHHDESSSFKGIEFLMKKEVFIDEGPFLSDW